MRNGIWSKKKNLPDQHVGQPAEAVNKAAAESSFYEVRDCYIKVLI